MPENKTIASIKVDIARLEEKNNSLNEKVDEIKNNHLAHIAADIKDLTQAQIKTNLKIAYWSGGVAVVVIIVQVLAWILK